MFQSDSPSRPLTGAIIDGKSYATIVSIREKEENIPSTLKLFQNYPNPFNPSTTITYAIPSNTTTGKEVQVILRVYDILGKEVATLVNKKESPGEYTVNFNGANLPSGIYIYSIQTGDKLLAKKMCLLK